MSSLQMTVHHQSSVGTPSEPLSGDERRLVAELRSRLIDVMGEIPSDLDTDLNLGRWIRGYHGQIERIVKVRLAVC
jgi:hypothetical protein